MLNYDQTENHPFHYTVSKRSLKGRFIFFTPDWHDIWHALSVCVVSGPFQSLLCHHTGHMWRHRSSCQSSKIGDARTNRFEEVFEGFWEGERWRPVLREVVPVCAARMTNSVINPQKQLLALLPCPPFPPWLHPLPCKWNWSSSKLSILILPLASCMKNHVQ